MIETSDLVWEVIPSYLSADSVFTRGVIDLACHYCILLCFFWLEEADLGIFAWRIATPAACKRAFACEFPRPQNLSQVWNGPQLPSVML